MKFLAISELSIVMVLCAVAQMPVNAQTPLHDTINEPADSIGATSAVIEKKVYNVPVNLSPGGRSQAPLAPLDTVASSMVDVSVLDYDAHLKNLRGLKVYVRNRSDRALLCSGFEATATVDGATYNACTFSTLDKVISPPQTLSKTIATDVKSTVTATVTVGAVQAVQDQLLYSGPVLKRYGHDEARRSDEQEIFGKRILWPGDSTTGTIYFSTANPLDGASLKLPISGFYNHDDRAFITVGK